MTPEWKQCVECNAYEISNCGDVRRSIDYPYRGFVPFKNLVQVYDKRGYRKVCMRSNGIQLFKTVHCLVASAFLGVRPFGYEVNHKDGDKKNNSIGNLEYVTKRENKDHAKKLGLYAHGVDVNTAKLTSKEVKEIRDKFPSISQGKLSKMYGINQAHISRIIRREAWASVI